MARRRNNGQHNDQPDRWSGDESDELLHPRDAAENADGHEEMGETADFSMERSGQNEDSQESEDAVGAGAADDESEDAMPPSASDLASRGFTPDEVQRLVVVSDRQAHSDESQLAEATLRRLRFTRWLIEHGMLNEWSA